MRLRIARPLSLATCLAIASGTAEAQSSGFSFGMHANTDVSAADLGLAVYPGATVNHHRHGDAAFDIGLTLNHSEYRIRGIQYLSRDASAHVFAFYRDALSRYGQVLECDHGSPVGELTRTDTGLTCRDDVNDGDSDDRTRASEHDLRVGSPHNFRLVGVDESQESTEFVLMMVEIARHHHE